MSCLRLRVSLRWKSWRAEVRGSGTHDGADYFAFVTRVSTSDLDIFMSIASDGTHLYVVGASGWDQGSWSTATPIVASLPLSLSGFAWSTVPADMRLATDVVVDDGVYVTGLHDTQGRVLRCTLDGQCP